ncbi:MAG TPA: NmrA family NAD(P)-binding protein [Solirubrobacterales bacterium]|nr:NmrA family NAD(P)-binding protein [Solirubrobacterales bacterium]
MAGPRILLTGATGFIGRQLAGRLIDDGYSVRCLARSRGAGTAALEQAGCELALADLTGSRGLREALEDVDVAYFLVHMIGGVDYPATERAAASRFARAAEQAGVERIIYLGGLGDTSVSQHLASRHEVARILAAEGPPLTYFRAAMVIGPGSESYELLRGIVARVPALPAPDWLKTPTQPIGARDVVAYLRAALDVPESAGREIQIGGPDVVTHLELVSEMARAMGRRPPRLIPMSAEIARPETIAAAAAAVTPATPAVAVEISRGLTTPTVVTDPSGGELFAIRPRRLDAVLAEAVDSAAAVEAR